MCYIVRDKDNTERAMLKWQQTQCKDKSCQSLNKHYKDDDDDDMAAYVAPKKRERQGKEGREQEIATPCFVWP